MRVGFHLSRDMEVGIRVLSIKLLGNYGLRATCIWHGGPARLDEGQ